MKHLVLGTGMATAGSLPLGLGRTWIFRNIEGPLCNTLNYVSRNRSADTSYPDGKTACRPERWG